MSRHPFVKCAEENGPWYFSGEHVCGGIDGVENAHSRAADVLEEYAYASMRPRIFICP